MCQIGNDMQYIYENLKLLYVVVIFIDIFRNFRACESHTVAGCLSRFALFAQK